MDKRLAKYLLLLPLFEIGNSLADLSQEGQNFGGNLLEKQQSTLNEKKANEKLQNLPGYQAYQNGKGSKEEGENSRVLKEMQGTFSANMDRGLKNADIIKSELSKMNAQKLNNNHHSTEPSLNQTEELLKQKHRWHIPENDPVLNGNTLVSNSKEKTEKETKLKKEAEINASPPDKIILCRESINPVTIHCLKHLGLTPVSQDKVVKEVSVSYSRGTNDYWHGSDREISINLKTGISTSSCSTKPSVSVSPTLGDFDNPEQGVVELKASSHGHNYHGRFYLSEAPSAANGYVAKFKESGYWFWFWRNVNATYTWKITIQPKPKLEEHWEGCELEEQRVKENYCRLISKEPRGVNETKRIDGYPDLVKRDFWSEQRNYLCGSGSPVSECQKYQKEGCEQIASKCLKREKEYCVEYEQTYRCAPKIVQDIKISIMPEISAESNLKKSLEDSHTFEVEDFGEALGEFSALTEMGNQMKDGLGGIKGDPKNPSIFHGECQRCSIKLGSSFQDCCQLSGLALGLIGGCREGEKKLANAAVKDKRCYKVQGKYCTTKVLGICVEEKEAYCCYGSQIAKIIQEIAHHQLNISWGSGENPNCGSLTVEQLSRLDFDTPFARQKLSTLIAEMQATAQDKLNKVKGNITGRGDMNNRLEALQKSLGNHFSKGHPKRSEKTVSPHDPKQVVNK